MRNTIRLGAVALACACLMTACASRPVQREEDLPVQVEGAPIITHVATITTNYGDIKIELYGKDAPKTVSNFVGLAERGFYNDILFHRIAPGFVIQAGDPQTKDSTKQSMWGSGGESIYGGTFTDELNPQAPSYQRGYVEGTMAMANRGPNTNTSQFFIMLKDVQLPKSYTIFGKVYKGMDVVHAIENVKLQNESSMGGTPANPVRIIGVKVTTL